MSAVLSPCGLYRFRLGRQFGLGARTVLWIMLNPSTADAEKDDPTIRRCIAFSKSWGFDRLLVGNLFALRATDPKELRYVRDPFGIGNTRHLKEMARESEQVIAAWGACKFVARDHELSILREVGESIDKPVFCLGKTKSGAPRHPLYVKGDTARLALSGGVGHAD